MRTQPHLGKTRRCVHLTRLVGLGATLSIVAFAAALSACRSDPPSGASSTPTTARSLTKDEYHNQANRICTEGAAKAAAVQPRVAMTPEQNIEALRALAATTRETLRSLRALVPPTPARPYEEWLATVDKTATVVEQGAAALAAGDMPTAQDRFAEAGTLSSTAQGAARLLGLDACLFDGTAPTTTASASPTTLGPSPPVAPPN